MPLKTPGHEAAKDFIEQHENMSVEQAALLLSKTDLPRQFILDQLAGRKIARNKLPSWHATEEIIYPPRISMEQCSSEATASYKASLYSGETVIDLSGGFGVDSFFLSRQFRKVIYLEPNPDLLAIVRHNFSLMGAKNVTFVSEEAASFLEKWQEKVDFIYVDPSRRNEKNEKKHKLTDCSPDVLALQQSMSEIAGTTLIKTSPFLDITQSLEQLSGVSRVLIIALHNECKEVLYELKKNEKKEPSFECVHLLGDETHLFSFLPSEEKKASADYSPVLNYLYEPNAAILKAGAFKTTASRFGLYKLAPNTHLYTSTAFKNDFPGKIFAVQAVGPYNKHFTDNFSEKKAIITMRNFRDKLPAIKKKLKIAEGGTDYLIATSDLSNKPVLIKARRLN